MTDAPADKLNALEPQRPLAPLRLGGTAKPWPVVDGHSYRPGYNLKPYRLWNIFRTAELGHLAPQCDTFEDLNENDGHHRGQYESRLSSVAFRPWIMLQGDSSDPSLKASAVLWRALRKLNMLECLWHLMDALGKGFSGVNIAWGLDEEGYVVPSQFLLAPHRRFMVDQMTNCLRFRTEDDSGLGVELTPGEWMVAQRPGRLIARAGLQRTTSWWCVFKRMSIADWIVFAEKFGIPIVLGYYQERASPESRAALLQAITDIGSDGQAILADLTKIVVDNTATRFGDVNALHPAIAARCDAEISKVLTGATLNVESGGPGSFALGRVHESRATSLSFADAFWLQDLFMRQVCDPFLKYNPRLRGALTPQLSIRVQPEMDPQTRAKVYQILQVMGLQIEDEQMYEEFGLRKPSTGVVLKPTYAVPAPTQPVPASP